MLVDGHILLALNGIALSLFCLMVYFVLYFLCLSVCLHVCMCTHFFLTKNVSESDVVACAYKPSTQGVRAGRF